MSLPAPQPGLCEHPMKQMLAEHGRGNVGFWWCPTCDLTWRDALEPQRAGLREDRVPNPLAKRKTR